MSKKMKLNPSEKKTEKALDVTVRNLNNTASKPLNPEPPNVQNKENPYLQLRGCLDPWQKNPSTC